MNHGQNLGRLVKWKDNEGGWHTGKVVLHPYAWEDGSPRELDLPGSCGEPMCHSHMFRLVVESYSGELTYVDSSKLERYPMRSEWEEEVSSGETARA